MLQKLGCLDVDRGDAKAAPEELHTLQLCAISLASRQNTESSVKDRIGPGHPYHTPAYADVCLAVDREMKLLDENAALRAAFHLSGEARLARILRRRGSTSNAPAWPPPPP
jgi:hypothetical protein